MVGLAPLQRELQRDGMKRRAAHVHHFLPGGEEGAVVEHLQRVAELCAHRHAAPARQRAQPVRHREGVLELEAARQRGRVHADVVVTECAVQQLPEAVAAQHRRVHLDDGVKAVVAHEVRHDLLDLVGGAPVEGAQRGGRNDARFVVEAAEPGEIIGYLRPQLLDHAGRILQPAYELLHLWALDSGEVVADREVENHIMEVRGCAGLSVAWAARHAEDARLLEHPDQHPRLHILLEALPNAQLLRELDVVADIRHVDAGAANRQAVVHLHGLQLHDAGAAEPAQHDVLRELGVGSGRGAERGSGRLAARDDAHGHRGVGGPAPELCGGQVKDARVAPVFTEHPAHERGKGQWIQFGHDQREFLSPSACVLSTAGKPTAMHLAKRDWEWQSADWITETRRPSPRSGSHSCRRLTVLVAPSVCLERAASS